ncbi:MAG: methyltransferase domain-containing protein [Acidimicrobiales bacterium]
MTSGHARRSRAAVASDALVSRILKATRAIHGGFWLGMLDAEQFDETAEIAYGTWEKYREPNYNLSGLAPWEDAAVAAAFPSSGRILVPCAGGGREVAALASRGFDVVGTDPSNELVRSANDLLQANGIAGRVYHDDPGRVSAFDEAPFDGALIGWGGYHHIAGRDARLVFLSDVRSQLKANAPILLSFFVRADEDPYVNLAFRVAVAIRKLRRSKQAVQIGDTVSATFDHYFTRNEVRREVEEAGFSVIQYSASPYGHLIARVAAP